MALDMISRFRGSPFAFPLAALTALAMFFISETSYQQATGALERSRTVAVDFAMRARTSLNGEVRRDQLERLTYAVVNRTA
jgi:hypothetical protein